MCSNLVLGVGIDGDSSSCRAWTWMMGRPRGKRERTSRNWINLHRWSSLINM